jgi:hypothetical protein
MLRHHNPVPFGSLAFQILAGARAVVRNRARAVAFLLPTVKRAAMAEPNLQKPGDIPKDPFPIPARPTQPPELTPSDPVNIPPPGQDVIFPANEPVGIPPVPDAQPLPEPPGVF